MDAHEETEPSLQARCWIKCDSRERLLALRERWVEMFGGEMTDPEPHRRFLVPEWPSPVEGRGTSLEWEQTLRNGLEQVSMALEGFEGAYLYALHVEPIDPTEYPADTVNARRDREPVLP